MNNQKCPKGARLVPLQNSPLFAIVDACDYDLVMQFQWNLDRNSYVAQGRGFYKLHQLLLEAIRKPLQRFDHINTNRLDNRSMNLRPATGQQNMHNSNKVRSRKNPDGSRRKPTSRFKGVFWNKLSRKWTVSITPPRLRTTVCLGHFTDEILAAKTYDKFARKYFGEFARTNKMMNLFD